MSIALTTKFFRESASVLVHFAHGGLLVTGMLVMVLLFTHVSGAEDRQEGWRQIGGWIGAGRAEQAASSDDQERAVMDGEIRTTVDYLSRKYRVAGTAVEPLVVAARTAGERLRLDPMLILAVMAIESGFNPIAESPMGAQGPDAGDSAFPSGQAGSAVGRWQPARSGGEHPGRRHGAEGVDSPCRFARGGPAAVRRRGE
jgi:hypothetical protein